MLLVGANHAAGHARAGIAGRLAGIVILRRMHDDGAAHDVGGGVAPQTNAIHLRIHMRYAAGIGDEVVAIARVVCAVAGAAVRLHRRVEMAAGAAGIGRAAIAFFMDMKTVATARL